MALDKPLEEITEADLKALIEAATPERKTLEYKQTFPAPADDERREFLADVSSFANSTGGNLIYGMRADDGLPVELCGVEGEGDGVILRLENMIRDGVAPRIAGVHSTAVKLAKGKIAVVIRVPKSFVSPHMVTFKNTSRFFARTSNGKYQLNVDEIRTAFLGSETTAERIRNFRLERTARIRARDVAVRLVNGACATLHLVPVNSFASVRYDVVGLSNKIPIITKLAPLFSDHANDWRINFDGLLVASADEKKVDAFLQIYRNGIVETANTGLLTFAEKYGRGKTFSSLVFEVKLIRSLKRMVEVLQSLGVDLPLVVMFSLLDIKGYAMARKGRVGFPETDTPFDRDVLAPQEVLIDSYDADLPLTMKPILDEISNAAGLSGSSLYENGKWIGEEEALKAGGV